LGTYRNPILSGCNPDPSICEVDGTYYMVTSTFEYLPGLPVHRSTNLVDWEPVGHVIIDQLDYTGIAASKGLYAPTLRYHDGTFYVVCTHIPGEEVPPARAGHFLVTANDPAGPWSEAVWFEGLEGIDPSLTFDGDRVWLCWTFLAEPGLWHGQCDIWLVELDPRTYVPMGVPQSIWRGALLGAGWAEGPHIHPRPGGGWMLIAAEGGTNRDHAICVAYADDIEGPYVGDEGNPRLTHRFLGDQADIADVGHADLVQATDGSWWSVMLATHQHDGVNSLRGRQTHLVPVEFESGRPLFAPGTGRVAVEMTADGVPDQLPPVDTFRDDFDADALDLGWNAVRWLPSNFVDLAARQGFARLRATTDEPTIVGRTSFMGRRLGADTSRMAARFELDDARTLRAGLLLRTTETGLLELAVHADGVVRGVLVDDGVRTEVGAVGVGVDGPVDLSISVDRHVATLVANSTAVGVVDIRCLATGRPMWFMGSWWGPFAVGAGHVDVDFVEVNQGVQR